MKKLSLILVILLIATTVFGCTPKQDNTTSSNSNDAWAPHKDVNVGVAENAGRWTDTGDRNLCDL